jgi:hypothetical protein
MKHSRFWATRGWRLPRELMLYGCRELCSSARRIRCERAANFAQTCPLPGMPDLNAELRVREARHAALEGELCFMIFNLYWVKIYVSKIF